MKLLTNSMDSFVTTDDVADAVVAYHVALSRLRDIEIVTVPVVDEHGAVRRAAIAVGWLTGLTVTTASYPAANIESEAVASELRAKASALLEP